jgi:hypothetical protein
MTSANTRNADSLNSSVDTRLRAFPRFHNLQPLEMCSALLQDLVTEIQNSAFCEKKGI